MFWQDLVFLISSFLKMPHLPRYDPLDPGRPRPPALPAPSEQPVANQLPPRREPCWGWGPRDARAGAAPTDSRAPGQAGGPAAACGRGRKALAWAELVL